MTLAARNNSFKIGIIIAAFSLFLAIIGGFFAYSAFSEASALAVTRSGGIILKLAENFAEPSAYAPFWILLVTVACSLFGIILISYFFEKTQSPEILFIGFFMVSLAFEVVRLAVPLRVAFPFSAMYLTVVTRILLFGRYLGLFSLFAASIYAAGLNAHKQQNFFLMLILAAMIIAINIPVDSLNWDSTFKLLSGYQSMFTMVEIGLLFMTVLSFLVGAYKKGSKRYIFIGAGAFLLFAGRNILFHSDNWFSSGFGLVFLVAGVWLVCSRLHQEYLWL